MSVSRSPRRRSPSSAAAAANPRQDSAIAADSPGDRGPSLGAQRLIPLGRLGRPHGLRGEIRLFPYSDGEAIVAAKRLYVAGRELRVASLRRSSDALLIRFDGIETADDAARLKHLDVALPRGDFPLLAEDEIYWIDLVGLACVGAERHFGRIVEVFEAGAHPILRARADDGREELIPYVGAIVRRVDLEGGCVYVDWSGLD